MIAKILLILNIFWFSFAYSSDDICKKWFDKARLKPGPSCQMKCVSTSVGMDSFYCTDLCADLCGVSVKTQILQNLAYYPGLTKKERVLIGEEPKTALKVFLAKQKAESATMKRLKRNHENDESDAFRHFVWAGLLRWDVGLEKARLFTEAHEMLTSNPSLDDTAMDLSNNRAGMLAAEELEKLGKKTQNNLEERALQELKEGRLIVKEKKGLPK